MVHRCRDQQLLQCCRRHAKQAYAACCLMSSGSSGNTPIPYVTDTLML